MFSFLVFIITLSILILVHELGHFWVAKKAGIKVEEFGIGYPPRAWSKKIGETVYSINWVPFGGFVRLYGEELKETTRLRQGSGEARAFWAKSKKVRTAVIVAGVLGNFLLAIVCFSAVYSVSGIPTVTDQVRVIGITTGSPADQAGLQNKDLILAVDGQAIKDIEHFTQLIGDKKGQEVVLLVKRETDKTIVLTPRKDPPEGEGALGVVISSLEMKRYPWWQMPFRGAVEGIKEAVAWGGLILGSFGKMLVDWIGRGIAPKDVAGPVGIFQASANVTQQGILAILQFMGILSINLGILNILPFPALDGGRLVFVIYEAVTRRRPKPAVEHWVNAIGMAVLLFLIILVTINDVQRVINTTSIISRFRSLWPF